VPERRKGDADLLATARVIGLYTLTALIAFTVVFDQIGRMTVATYTGTDSAIFMPLVGAWTALMGIETASLLRQRRNGHNEDDDVER
jgi:LPXTG-motif cell wall-anchored protein